MLLVSFALIATYYLCGDKPDIVLLILTPLAMFNAEAMPVDVEKINKKNQEEILLEIFCILIGLFWE